MEICHRPAVDSLKLNHEKSLTACIFADLAESFKSIDLDQVGWDEADC